MNEQKSPLLHDINFKDAQHKNLYYFAQHLGLKVDNPSEFSIEEQEWRERYKVSLGTNQLLYLSKKLAPHFWMLLAEEDKFTLLEEMLNDSKNFAIFPKIDVSFNTIDENTEFAKLVGEDYLNIDRRMEGLITASKGTIREIAGIINKRMEEVAEDTDIVKDFDGILTFNTGLGEEFKLELCFDKVPPVSETNNGLVIERTPITLDDLKTYLGDAGKAILTRLDHINQMVSALFNSKKIAESKELTRYVGMALNATLVRAFLDQNVTYISFGGKDDWSSNGKETPNNKACFEILDAETEKLFQLLDNIPKEEGVDVYSVDIDTFGVFGRNNNNKVVTPVLEGYTEQILKDYSQGFERVLSLRLAQLDTPYIFRA